MTEDDDACDEACHAAYVDWYAGADEAGKRPLSDCFDFARAQGAIAVAVYRHFVDGTAVDDDDIAAEDGIHGGECYYYKGAVLDPDTEEVTGEVLDAADLDSHHANLGNGTNGWETDDVDDNREAPGGLFYVTCMLYGSTSTEEPTTEEPTEGPNVIPTTTEEPTTAEEDDVGEGDADENVSDNNGIDDTVSADAALSRPFALMLLAGLVAVGLEVN